MLEIDLPSGETFRAARRLRRMYDRRTDAGLVWVWAFLAVAIAMVATGIVLLMFGPLT